MNSFMLWADGKNKYKLNTTRVENKDKIVQTKKEKTTDEILVKKYSKVFKVLCIISVMALITFLIFVGSSMPSFGNENNATNNEVPNRYVSMVKQETGAENAIAGMILNYRGFDTFGESCVLFLAVCSVMILVWEPNSKVNDKSFNPDPILTEIVKIIVPFLLLFGLCILMNGHVSPGGGFSGGSILGASLILFAIAFGKAKTEEFFTDKVFNVIRITGLMIYAIMFGVYIYQGANIGESYLGKYIVSIIDIAVGLVVMSTMYGFYCFFEKGRI